MFFVVLVDRYPLGDFNHSITHELYGDEGLITTRLCLVDPSMLKNSVFVAGLEIASKEALWIPHFMRLVWANDSFPIAIVVLFSWHAFLL